MLQTRGSDRLRNLPKVQPPSGEPVYSLTPDLTLISIACARYWMLLPPWIMGVPCEVHTLPTRMFSSSSSLHYRGQCSYLALLDVGGS